MMHRLPKFLTAALAATTFSFTAGAQAADFHPISAVEVNMISGNPGGNPLSNVIEGSGVGFAATEPHDATGGVWYTDAPGGFPSDYITFNPGPEYIWFDLGSDVLLSEISFWGYAAGNSNGMREFNLSFATDAEGGDAGVLGDEDYGDSITANPAFAAVQNPTPRQSFRFDPVTARYVRVEATSTFFDQPGAGAGGDRLGIGEIAFANVIIPDDPTISVVSAIALDGIAADIVEFDVTVRNSGTADLMITGTNFTGPNAAAFSVVGAPVGPIAGLTSGNLALEFDPTGLEGPISATLQIMSNDPNTPTAEVMISGTVPPSAQNIIVSDPPVSRSVATTKVIDIPVANNGGSALTISGTSLSGPDVAAFSVLSAPASVAGLSSGVIQVQVDGQGLQGLIAATLQIASDDPDTPVAEVLIEAVALGDAAEFFPIATAESSTAANDLWAASNLIQGPGNGFDSATPYTKLLDGAAGNWVTNACGFPCDYIATTGQPVLTFDLGENVALGEISLWGYAATNSNGVSEFSLRFATQSEGLAGFGSSIAYNPTFGGIDSGEFPNIDNTSRFSFPFAESAFARYVEMTCTDNHFIAPGNGTGGEIAGGDRVGLGEVAFAVLSAPSGDSFEVTSIELVDGNAVIVFRSRPGRVYGVFRSTDLRQSPWEELDDSLSSGGETTTFTDDQVPAGAPRVFYQIRLSAG